jgi:hypothetical protein
MAESDLDLVVVQMIFTMAPTDFIRWRFHRQ